MNFTLIVFCVWVDFWELVVLLEGRLWRLEYVLAVFSSRVLAVFTSRVLAVFTSRVLAVFSSRVEVVCINVEAKGLSVLGSGISLGAVPTVGVGAERLYIAVRAVIIVDVDSKTTQYLHVSYLI